MNYSANDNLEVMKIAKNYNKFLVDNVVELIKKCKFENILDFGCADGFFIKKIKDKVINASFFGVECDDESYCNCLKSKIEVKKNIDEYKIKFDLIYSFNVLEHIEDDLSALDEFNRYLNRGGKLILYLPAFNFLYCSMDKKVGHYRRYNKAEILHKLKQANFIVNEIMYCDSLGVLATLLYKVKDAIKTNNGNINYFLIKLYDFLFPLSIILDKIVFSRFLGKNLIVIASKV